MMNKLFVLVFTVLISIPASSQSRKKILETTNNIIQSNWDNFFKMLSIPNDGYDTPNIEKNIEWCESTFSRLGFEFERVKAETTSPSMPNHPLLIGSRFISNNYKTVLIYFHMDGQPVDPTKWNQSNPFIPILTENIDGNWVEIDRDRINYNPDPDWRILGDLQVMTRATNDVS